VSAGVLWVTGTGSIDLRGMEAPGVASVLPERMWVALALLAAAAAAALLDRRPPHWLLALNVVVLCGCLFGLSSMVSRVPRGAIVFRHAGITNALVDSGSVDRRIDAYFDWPGFFTS